MKVRRNRDPRILEFVIEVKFDELLTLIALICNARDHLNRRSVEADRAAEFCLAPLRAADEGMQKRSQELRTEAIVHRSHRDEANRILNVLEPARKL